MDNIEVTSPSSSEEIEIKDDPANLPYPHGLNLEDYSEAELVVLTLFSMLIGLTSTVVNGGLVFVFVTTRSLHSPMNALFMSLIVDGLICGLFGGWFSFGFGTSRTRMPPFFCGLHAFVVFFSGSYDIFTLNARLL